MKVATDMIRILVVDDSEYFRRQVKSFLASEPDLVVVGDAVNCHEAIQKTRELRPDLVLMDIRMSGMSGIEAIHLLKNEIPELKVIILTVFDVQEYKDAALATGANEYIVKKYLIEELVPAIRRTMQVALFTL